MANDKPRNVPNAADADKDESDSVNAMGHPERTVKEPGKRTKRVLNELDPEDQDDIEKPIHLREFAMARPRISEAVQDKKGVKGDFMDSMGGRTDKLGGKQKNTGATEAFGNSSTGEPCDGITSHISDLNLKTKQKNTGGFDEFGDSTSTAADDGITDAVRGMGSELGQNSLQKNKGGQFEPLKGSTNRMSEDWSLGNIASIMEGEDVDLQKLFDAYAGQSTFVCLEDFQEICNARGVHTILSEQNLKVLMSASRKFMFYEGNDASGKFWQPHPLTEMVGSGDVAADVPVSKMNEDDMEAPGRSDPTLAPLGAPTDEIEPDAELAPDLEGGDELADVFQQIGDDFSRAANIIAGHDESEETPEDEAAEGDIPISDIGGESEAGEVGEQGEAGEEVEEMCEEQDLGIGDDAASPDQGGLMDRIGSAVKGKSSAVAMRGREEDEENANDERDGKPKVESRHRCTTCGSLLDESGCLQCALMREADEFGKIDGRDTSADSHGYLKGDKTKKGKGELGTSIPSADTSNSTSGSAGDGITSEVPGKQTPLKPKLKNTGGQAPLKGGSGTMKENILCLSRLAKQAIADGARKIGRAGKYVVRFGVKAEGSSATFQTLTEALAVVEELMQAYGSKEVVLEALYHLPHQQPVIYRHRLPLASIKRRDPIVCEGKVLFKTAKVANAFADNVVSEGIACRVKNHNWGAAVSGLFDWPLAQKAFRTIPEAWGAQVRSPAQERLAGRAAGQSGPYAQNSLAGGLPQDTIGPEEDDLPPEEVGEPEVDEMGEPSEFGEPGEAHNPEAPGFFDMEGDLCPNCGSAESPDESGKCYACGEMRPGGSPETVFGARPDENLAQSDDILDMSARMGP